MDDDKQIIKSAEQFEKRIDAIRTRDKCSGKRCSEEGTP